jgi:hypothetical protein
MTKKFKTFCVVSKNVSKAGQEMTSIWFFEEEKGDLNWNI